MADANQENRVTKIPECGEHVKVGTKDVALLAANQRAGIELEGFGVLGVEDVVDDAKSDDIGPAVGLQKYGWWIAVGWWWIAVEALRDHPYMKKGALDEAAQCT